MLVACTATACDFAQSTQEIAIRYYVGSSFAKKKKTGILLTCAHAYTTTCYLQFSTPIPEARRIESNQRSSGSGRGGGRDRGRGTHNDRDGSEVGREENRVDLPRLQ